LFPSLGPTIFVVTLAPNERIVRFRNIIFGHGLGSISALVAIAIVRLFQHLFCSSELCSQFGPNAAAALAIALTMLMQVPAHAIHPPAAATTMLLVLGGIKAEWRSYIIIMSSVLIIAIYGELIKIIDRVLKTKLHNR
jgi:CBS-domain-containing membrane protein